MTVEEERDVIATGNRLELFLTDPAVIEAVDKLDKRYYAQFKAAKSPEDIALVKAKSAVIEDLFSELRAVVSTGKHTEITRDRREKNQSTRGNGRK